MPSAIGILRAGVLVGSPKAGVRIRYLSGDPLTLAGLGKRTGPVERAGVLGTSFGGVKTENENIDCWLEEVTWFVGTVEVLSLVGSSAAENASVASTLEEVGDNEPNSLWNDNGALPGLRCLERIIVATFEGVVSDSSPCESLTTSSLRLGVAIFFLTCVRATEGGAMNTGGFGVAANIGVTLLRGRVERRKGVASNPSVKSGGVEVLSSSDGGGGVARTIVGATCRELEASTSISDSPCREGV